MKILIFRYNHFISFERLGKDVWGGGVFAYSTVIFFHNFEPLVKFIELESDVVSVAGHSPSNSAIRESVKYSRSQSISSF